MPKERDLLKIIWTNFRNSLRPRQIKGNYKGEDRLGNKYFEIPADPSRGKRKTSRWFEPQVKDRFDQDLPSEWESWLRYRRDNPPTIEEINRNIEILELTRKNALEKGYIPKKITEEKVGSFPKYEEYELTPGDKEDWKKGGKN